MVDPKYLLKNSLLNNYLNSQELDMIYAHSKLVSFSSGEIILQQGKESDDIYFILTGNVDMCAKILGEGITNLETLGPGNFLGEIRFIEQTPLGTAIIASSYVECISINRTFIEFLSDYSPEIKYKLYTAICKQVCDRLKTIHDKSILFISRSEMSTRSLFGEMIHSLTKPSEITLEEAAIDAKTFKNTSTAFHSFTDEEIDQLFKHILVLKVPKNCTLIHKGDKVPVCYVVVHGAVQSNIEHDTKIAKLSVIGPATLFASVSCIDKNSPFTITFTTCEQAILLKLSESDMAFFQNENPKLWYKLFDLICRSIVALEKSVDKLDIRLNIETYNR